MTSTIGAVLIYAAWSGMLAKRNSVGSHLPVHAVSAQLRETDPSCASGLSGCFSAPTPNAQASPAVNDSSDEDGLDSARSRVLVLRGRLRDREGNPLTGDTGILFTIYDREIGGSPIWQEAQNVEANELGHFKVLIGSTTQGGVPRELIAEQNLWLDQQVLLPNAEIPPRLPLTIIDDRLVAEPGEQPMMIAEQSDTTPPPEIAPDSDEVVPVSQDEGVASNSSHRAHRRHH